MQNIKQFLLLPIQQTNHTVTGTVRFCWKVKVRLHCKTQSRSSLPLPYTLCRTQSPIIAVSIPRRFTPTLFKLPSSIMGGVLAWLDTKHFNAKLVLLNQTNENKTESWSLSILFESPTEQRSYWSNATIEAVCFFYCFTNKISDIIFNLPCK